MSVLPRTKNIINSMLLHGKCSYILNHRTSSVPLYQSVASYKRMFKNSMSATNPIIDGPDYTYLDGKSSPLRAGQRRRAIKQRTTVTLALELMKQVKFAVKRHEEMTENEKEERNRTIEEKLKEKSFTPEWEQKRKR